MCDVSYPHHINYQALSSKENDFLQLKEIPLMVERIFRSVCVSFMTEGVVGCCLRKRALGGCVCGGGVGPFQV